MKQLLTNFGNALKEAKKGKSLGKSVTVLLVAAVVFALALAVPGLVSGTYTTAGVMALGVFLAVFLGGLFIGYVFKTLMGVLGGTGEYFEGLTAFAYPLVPISVGALLAIILGYVPFIGSVLSFIVFAVFAAVGFAGVYRATKDLFAVDMITAFVGVAVLTSVVFAAVYIALIPQLVNLLPLITKAPVGLTGVGGTGSLPAGLTGLGA